MPRLTQSFSTSKEEEMLVTLLHISIFQRLFLLHHKATSLESVFKMVV